jgi:hypothetical protein
VGSSGGCSIRVATVTEPIAFANRRGRRFAGSIGPQSTSRRQRCSRYRAEGPEPPLIAR